MSQSPSSSSDVVSTEVTIPTADPSSFVPDIRITTMKRPRYTVDVEETTHYCQNVDAVVKVLGEYNRVISTGDVFKSLDMKPSFKYRLRERLNGAIIQKIARV
jgi:hypothetical protein